MNKASEVEVVYIGWMEEKTGLSKGDLERAKTDQDYCLNLLANAEKNTVQELHVAAFVLNIIERNGWAIPDGSVYNNRNLRAQMRRIASGEVLPEVYLHLDPPMSRIVQRFPQDDQRRIIDNRPITVYTGEGDTLEMEPRNMLPKIREQVFDADGGRIRDVSAQRAYLENERRREITKPQPIAEYYEVKGHKVHILRPSILTQKDLIHLAGLLA